ncbi:M10 family metallopeptidase C-terminal domain-containing protein [Leptolyngbya sp. 15MV]|nr:M10 family metallopeptidase C-terminal domain-containing protein [Leptolyngbya sp. 15MV]
METGVWLSGNAVSNRITGSDRSDVLRGYAGDDSLHGGLGADTLEGGDGHDRLDGGAHGDMMRGGRGGDVYIVDSTADRVEEKGGDGAVDHIDSLLATMDLRLHAEVEGLHFKTAADCYGFGNALNNIIGSHRGNDTMLGFGGDDAIHLGEGRNAGYGGTGADTISTEGRANSVLSGDDGNDLLTMEDGSNWAYGGNGNDTIQGGMGSDRLYGDAGNDQISATYGEDWYYGYFSGDAELHGGSGHDTLWGSIGDDTLTGGAGRDHLSGSWGDDIFRYEATTDSRGGGWMDSILDFTRGEDLIDLSAIDADTTQAGNQAFAFTGHGASLFQGAGDLWISTTLMGCNVNADTNGDGVADLLIAVRGVPTLAATDFIL